MKRFIPISEYCRRAPWLIRPERIRAWCRDGRRGKRPPFMLIGGRYFVEPDTMTAWMTGGREPDRKTPRRNRTAAKIRKIVDREEQSRCRKM